MVAFNNDPILKQKCLNLILEFGHLKGINNDYLPRWHGKDRPPFYETELGLPGWLFIFEFPMEVHLPSELGKSWHFDYFNAIPVGADLSRVLLALNHWMLTDPTYGEWRYFTKNNREIGLSVISLYSRELYSPTQARGYDDDWFQVWCQVANPIYWSDGSSKMFHGKHSFIGYVQNPIAEMPSIWFGRSDEEEGFTDKFVLEVRERVLSLIMNASNI